MIDRCDNLRFLHTVFSSIKGIKDFLIKHSNDNFFQMPWDFLHVKVFQRAERWQMMKKYPSSFDSLCGRWIHTHSRSSTLLFVSLIAAGCHSSNYRMAFELVLVFSPYLSLQKYNPVRIKSEICIKAGIFSSL